jgi:hypothetical protein
MGKKDKKGVQGSGEGRRAKAARPEPGAAEAAFSKPLQELQQLSPAVLPPDAEETWPPLLLGATPVSLAFHDLYRRSIFAISAFLTPPECAAWMRYGETHGFQEAKQRGGGGYAHRDNGRIVVFDEGTAHAIFQRIRAFVPPTADGRQAEGCAPNLRLYRYWQGQRFGKHVDDVVKHTVPLPADGSKPAAPTHQTEFTLLIYLNGGVGAGEGTGAEPEAPASKPGKGKAQDQAQTQAQGKGEAPASDGEDEDADGIFAMMQHAQQLKGGETMFYSGSTGSKLVCSFAPAAGWALFHGHGDNCMVHEGGLVRSGVKYVLRTDVLFPLPAHVRF